MSFIFDQSDVHISETANHALAVIGLRSFRAICNINQSKRKQKL